MKKLKRVFLLAVCLFMIVSSIPVGAIIPYSTYTYDIDGNYVESPHAYVPYETISSPSLGLETPISEPYDFCIGKRFIKETGKDKFTSEWDGMLYIADGGDTPRVIAIKYDFDTCTYSYEYEMTSFVNNWGVPDSISTPRGLYATDSELYVCDTDAARILVFSTVDTDEYKRGDFIRIIEEPKSEVFPDDHIYKPIAVAVGTSGYIYVVSSTTYQGIISMNHEGKFTGFLGTQTQSMSLMDMIWRRFQTKEQRENSEKVITTEFNNISINPGKNLVYATTSSIKDADVESSIRGSDKSGKYSPVKLLNANGTEIMRRNGFWIPAGEVDYSSKSTDDITGPSTIVDVAVGPEDTWSMIDSKRNRVYTYDFDGNLLFAFGDNGTMLGNLGENGIKAIAYQGDVMLLLDKTNNNITVFRRTEYGDLLLSAIAAESTQEYDKAINLWTKVLQRNSNFDTAYVGIGQAMYRNKDYVNSLSYFESAYDTTNWSNSYREIRKEWMSTYFLVLLLIVVAVIVGVVLFFRTMGKINRRVAVSGKKRTFWQEVAYGFHVIFHPFDGFWDLKHEKRGSVRASLFFIALAIATFYYQAIGQGYLLNPRNRYSSLWAQLIGVVVPLFLFVLANWCLTTLFDGEGSFKDVFIACSYSLAPIPLLVIPATIYSNFCVSAETDIIGFIGTLAFIWLGILVFFGTMVTHDYSLGKNFVTILGTLIAMVFIMFIAVLFTTLIGKIVSLITNIVTEIQYRM